MLELVNVGIGGFPLLPELWGEPVEQKKSMQSSWQGSEVILVSIPAQERFKLGSLKNDCPSICVRTTTTEKELIQMRAAEKGRKKTLNWDWLHCLRLINYGEKQRPGGRVGQSVSQKWNFTRPNFMAYFVYTSFYLDYN